MDTSGEARIARQAEYLSRELKKASRFALWFGIVIGLVAGLALGFAIGYSQGSHQTIVIPLEQGVEI
ncbi:MAG: hypothetical protein H6985_20035 [Pseudomonadales bacterium]|nr:hypothetical protein [Pseudomonadales bacterium]